jgi:hypothetical protein
MGNVKEEINDTLPNYFLIIGALKTEDMICISSRGLCGEDDFGYRRENDA